MNQSFEDQLKNRLGNFQPAPAEGVKKRLFNRMAGHESVSYNAWQVAGFVMIVVALLQMMPKFGLEQKVLSDHTVVEKQFTKNREVDQEENLKLDEGKRDVREASHTGGSEEVKPKGGQVTTNTFAASSNSEQRNESTIYASDDQGSIDKPARSVVKGELLVLQRKEYISLKSDHSPGDIRHKRKAKTVVPAKKDKNYNLYYDLGTFFVYRQIMPNVTDEIVIENYRGPGRFSLSRMGWSGEVGLRRKLTDRIDIRSGLSVSTFEQNFSFSARDFKPDSVKIVEGSIASFQPYYEKEHYEFSTRLWRIGANFAADFYIFPSKSNSLFLNAAYQYNLVSRSEIRYRDADYSVFTPNQLMLTFGLRKKLFQKFGTSLYLIPNLSYAVSGGGINQNDLLSLKPFSAGLTLSIQRGN